MGCLKLNPSDMAQATRVSRPVQAETGANARLTGRDDITRPTPQFAGPRTKDRFSGAEQHALASLAQRFAPGTQTVAAPEAQRFPNRLPPLAFAAPSRIRTLIAVLIVVALLPSLTLAAMFWLGAVNTNWSRALGPENNEGTWPTVKAAAIMPVLQRVAPKPSADIRPATLAAPAKLEARAGRTIAFAIALDRTGALPARTVVAIGGLPPGAKLSSGRPYGETEWNLRSDEIGDLRLTLANVATGETRLRIRLIAPDGEIIAGTETVLNVTPGLNTAPVLSPQQSENLPRAWNPSEAYALSPGALYDPSLISAGAWDEQFQQPVGTQGVEETVASGEPVPPQPTSAAKTVNDDSPTKWVEPSAYVNLREGPSSSAAVISVIAKGTKLSLTGRKRGWMQVSNPATLERGWIYAGNVAGAKLRRGSKRAADSGSSPGSDALWSGLGQWLTSR